MSSDFEQIQVSNAKIVAKAQAQDSCLGRTVLIRMHQCRKILTCESSKDFSYSRIYSVSFSTAFFLVLLVQPEISA